METRLLHFPIVGVIIQGARREALNDVYLAGEKTSNGAPIMEGAMKKFVLYRTMQGNWMIGTAEAMPHSGFALLRSTDPNDASIIKGQWFENDPQSQQWKQSSIQEVNCSALQKYVKNMCTDYQRNRNDVDQQLLRALRHERDKAQEEVTKLRILLSEAMDKLNQLNLTQLDANAPISENSGTAQPLFFAPLVPSSPSYVSGPSLVSQRQPQSAHTIVYTPRTDVTDTSIRTPRQFLDMKKKGPEQSLIDIHRQRQEEKVTLSIELQKMMDHVSNHSTSDTETYK